MSSSILANLLMEGVEDKKDASDNNDSSGILGSKELNICNPTSSIARIVRAKTDKLRKREDPMFRTPPSSTPQRKKKRAGRDDGEIASKVVEETVIEYRGRLDYAEYDEISVEEKNIIHF